MSTKKVKKYVDKANLNVINQKTLTEKCQKKYVKKSFKKSLKKVLTSKI